MFYTYIQNNSGGSYVKNYDKGIGGTVIVEANSPEEADTIAENIGLYFDEDYEYDCECCGQRWYRAGSYTCYDQPGVYYAGDIDFSVLPQDEQSEGWKEPSVFVHYKDGSVVSGVGFWT